MEAFSKLGIDLVSVGLYLLNIGVLVALLTWILYKPLFKFLDERKTLIEGNIEEADTLKIAFQTKLAEIEEEKNTSSKHVKEQMEKTRIMLEAQKLSLEEEAQLEKEKLLSEARKLIEDEKGNILKSAEGETLALIQKILFHVLENKVPKEAIEASVEESWKQYSAR